MTNQYTVEIQTSPGVWTAVDGYQRDPLTITRGRADEQSQAAPQTMVFTLDNRSGKYSPRNPLSPLYGKVGRNIQVRCTIDNGTLTRYYGEIPSLAPQWDEAHSDNWVQVAAAGITRRLSQGQPTMSNALQDWVLAQPTLAAYYPLSGGTDTTSSPNIAPSMTGMFGGRNSPSFTYGADMGAAWLGTGMELNSTGDAAWMQGAGAATGAFAALDLVFQSPAIGVLDIQLWPDWDSYYNVRLNTSADAGTIQTSYFDGNDTLVTNAATGVIPALQDTQLHTFRLLLRNQPGLAIQYVVYIDGVAVDAGTNGIVQTLNGTPLFRFFYSRFTGQTVTNIAHVALWADNTEANLPSVTAYTAAAFAHAGETAVDRITRVCSDGDIALTTVGTAAESMPMGPQFTESRLEQIRDCESTDMGILLEQRDQPGLLYLSRTSLYNQTPAFTLNYPAGQVVAPLEPVDDDQATRNDVTATRRDGGSARYTVDTGPLSTLDPPNGVGRYATEVTVNVETDGMLPAIASWVANIGTLDESRWPSVSVNLQAPGMNSTLRAAIKAADVGDLFTITGMSKAFIYDDVNLIIVGYSETIDPFMHTITFNCMPADPYTVGVWSASASSGTFRWDTGGSTLNSSATSTATSLSVATAAGNALWTTDSNAFPFDVNIGGERVRVTNVTGASSPQTFTVTRSVNGVVKAQTSSTDVRLFDTPRWAL
jgi:hypothetical protein